MIEPVTETPEEYIRKPVLENLIDIDDDEVTSKSEDFDENPGDLYQDALESIPLVKRDDGMFRLNNETKDIGNNDFQVIGIY